MEPPKEAIPDPKLGSDQKIGPEGDDGDEFLDLTSKVYKLVVENSKDGVFQSKLWKLLGLTSRDGSRLAIRLERRGLIKRERILDRGRWTYKLVALKHPVNIETIEQSPCITCDVEMRCSADGDISPCICQGIAEWVLKEYEENGSKKSEEAEDQRSA